ncbi:hypothetical protein [Prochlorococcus sp. MIT 1223]|uniref:hypothetical protein n=1 Tax=Prochlorococcus sp. MIT 1223 TaxID=3096217 RepID=UPI002A750A99|nr:hypothetical protein [Prochlorococcus sp. MIT 1223]
MSNTKSENLKIEALQAKHLPMLASSEQTRRIGWMQIMLIKTWLSEAEGKLKGLIPKRQPKCLVALEGGDLIAIVVLQPNNRRGSCWSLSFPEFIKDPKQSTKLEASKSLLQAAIQTQKNVTQNWLIRLPSSETDQLSLSREIGFQPLKIMKSWECGEHPDPDCLESNKLPLNVSCQPLSRSNGQVLWRLKNRAESPQYRDIVDNQWMDLIDRNEPENLILLTKNQDEYIALLGLITPICSEELLSLEIIRDIAWDSRLIKSIPYLLNKLIVSWPKISIETLASDIHTNNILEELNWKEKGESVILGRTLWKRKANKNLVLKGNTLEAIFGGLKPNQPPLPSPFLFSKIK